MSPGSKRVQRERKGRQKEQPATDDDAEIRDPGCVVHRDVGLFAEQPADELRPALKRDHGGGQKQNRGDRQPAP
jgi:hypothetical protein